jgi:hypothetical protein
MKPPKLFKIEKNHGYSLCMACDRWKLNNRFHHDGIYWILCRIDFVDYWENTDELLPDYKGF